MLVSCFISQTTGPEKGSLGPSSGDTANMAQSWQPGQVHCSNNYYFRVSAWQIMLWAELMHLGNYFEQAFMIILWA
jgi:hypothetical protein